MEGNLVFGRRSWPWYMIWIIPIHRVDVMLCRVGDAIWECVLRTHVWLCRRVDSLITTCCIIRVWCGLMMFLSFTHALGKVPDIDNGHTVGRVHIHFVHMALIVRSSWKVGIEDSEKTSGVAGNCKSRCICSSVAVWCNQLRRVKSQHIYHYTTCLYGVCHHSYLGNCRWAS